VLAGPANTSHAGASAGVAEAIAFSDKDTLIRHADLALITSKRKGQRVSIYTPEMEPPSAVPDMDVESPHSARG
jgi:hypothetical protein